MACEFICDGCGKKQVVNGDSKGQCSAPIKWFICIDERGAMVACKRECIQKVIEKKGSVPSAMWKSGWEYHFEE